MNKKLAFKDFELRHLKLNSKNCPTIDWFDLTKKNDLLSVESDSQPHDDLLDKLKELRTIFAESLGLLDGWNFAREHVKANDERLKEALQSYNDEILRCTVTGFTLTDKGVKMTGKLSCLDGDVGLTSPMIKFETEDDDTDIGLRAKSLIDEISQEVWSFIYQGKR